MISWRPAVLGSAALFLMVAAAPTPARAQDVTAHARAVADFDKFDASQNGYLSGTEIDKGECRGYDKAGDGRSTALEYLTARGVIPGGAPATPASPAKP